MALAAVVFDLDDTLAVTERDRATLLEEATAAVGAPPIARGEYLDAHGRDLGRETREPIFAALLDGREEGSDGTASATPATLATAYREAVEGALAPVPGAAALVRELRTEYRVGLLTDGPVAAQEGKLAALGWADLFEAVVVTGVLDAGKPDGRAFQAVLDALGTSAAETVHVGDHPEHDVRGAKAAGLLAVQVLAESDEADPAANAAVERDRLAGRLPDVLAGFARAGREQPSGRETGRR
ncbi:HAD family hydrolase [Halobacteriales archaeon QS_4_69_34]|nr:MAG: HAD family hydrolase [Halobacteriales archaeon QS_4_69_34]